MMLVPAWAFYVLVGVTALAACALLVYDARLSGLVERMRETTDRE